MPLNKETKNKEENNNDENSYIGASELIYEWYNHQLCFNDRKFVSNITLFKHVWQIKQETGKSLKIKRDVEKKAHSYNRGNNNCRLYLEKKV